MGVDRGIGAGWEGDVNLFCTLQSVPFPPFSSKGERFI